MRPDKENAVAVIQAWSLIRGLCEYGQKGLYRELAKTAYFRSLSSDINKK